MGVEQFTAQVPFVVFYTVKFTDYRLVDCVYFLFLIWERLPIWMTETFWCVDSVVLITGDKMNKS